MWIARDKNGSLYAYLNKPTRFEDVFGETDTLEDAKTVVYMELPQDDFKDVTWENSPREITCCPSMIDKLNYHLDTTSKEELDKKFKELESFNNIGPTIEEYLGGVNYDDIKINAKINNDKSLKPEFVPNISWEEVRVNAAIQFMASLISSPNLGDGEMPAIAVKLANALIEELKK